MADIDTTLNACELVWRQQSIPAATVAEMRTELGSHLREATGAGKSVESVVGADINAFARTWANVQPDRAMPSTDRTQQALAEAADRTKVRLAISMATALLTTLIAAIFASRGDNTDIETWQWIFVIATFVLLAGELLSGGFFILPFALGSLAAAILAFLEIDPVILLLVFAVVSVLGLWGLREFASKDDDVVVPVGANRYVGQVAVVTEPIQGVGTVGRVRIDTESWAAITENNEHVPAGAVVSITAVRGARLVVSAG